MIGIVANVLLRNQNLAAILDTCHEKATRSTFHCLRARRYGCSCR